MAGGEQSVERLQPVLVALPHRETAVPASAAKCQRGTAIRTQLIALVEAMPDGVALADAHGLLLYLNRTGRTLLGLGQAEQIAHLSLSDLHPEGARLLVLQEGIPAARRDGQWSGETVLCSRDGREIPVLQVILAHKTPRGTVRYLSTIVRDLSERKRYEAQLAHLADHDPLTGLLNRRRFQQEFTIHLAQAQRNETNGALLFLDVDGLKVVNDRLGHEAGDALLLSLATLLRQHLREADVVARLGGDEFAVLLSPPDASHVEVVAERLLQAVRHHIVQVAEQPVGSTVSIGIALFPDHGTTVDVVLAHADLALYQAKASGRDAYCVYAPSRKT